MQEEVETSKTSHTVQLVGMNNRLLKPKFTDASYAKNLDLYELNAYVAAAEYLSISGG